MTATETNAEVFLRGDKSIIERFNAIGRSFRRVILIANNKNISIQNINSLRISETDLVVEFNTCLHHAFLADKKCQHLIFFRRRRDTVKHHGFPCSASMVRAVDESPGAYWFMFTGIDPVETTWPGFIDRPKFVVLSYTQILKHLADYPLPPDVEFAGPSTGFLMMRLLKALRDSAELKLWFGREFRLPKFLTPKASHFEILLVGFAPSTGPDFWFGHNWDYEKRWLENHRIKFRKRRIYAKYSFIDQV